MSAHKNIDKICTVIIVFTLIITLIFCNGQIFGIQTTVYAVGYENRIFDNSKVHTLDIVMNDWENFLETCESEEYSSCNVIIDGEAIKNVGIRGKGNTSLSLVRNMESNRYSFKIEFDHYDSTKSYHGLDKICLNNIIQDNTYMKDYLSYTLMNSFGVNAPLCSYVYITVNGEDWGLYLAVEGIEDSFLKRNYGSNAGELYKPDSENPGGNGMGNGKDSAYSDNADTENENNGNNNNLNPPVDFDENTTPDFENGDTSQLNADNFNNPQISDENNFHDKNIGSDDVKLKYIDDEIESYPNIFNNAKTDVSTADKKRLISSLKLLSEMRDIKSAVNVDEVVRYFVIHNFLCNGDSYTGEMIHNYYLYEKDGQLSMIPWDYNLAFGTFHSVSASSSVNEAIDTPVSEDMSDRPMIAWIFSDDEYTKQYHELFSDFIYKTDFQSIITETAAMIDKYVMSDPTKFCTYEEYQTGVKAITEFCNLRAESIKGQLNGTIPSTSDGQKNDSSSLIDASSLNIADMGDINMNGNFNSSAGGDGMNKMPENENNMQFHDGENTPPDFNSEDIPEIVSPPNVQNDNSNTDEKTVQDSQFNRPPSDDF